MDEKVKEEIGKAAKKFYEEQGNVPTAFAFQEGAKWGCSTFESKIKGFEKAFKDERELGLGWMDECKKLKELVSDRSRLAGEISRLREQHHDDCKVIQELRERVRELERRKEGKKRTRSAFGAFLDAYEKNRKVGK